MESVQGRVIQDLDVLKMTDVKEQCVKQLKKQWNRWASVQNRTFKVRKKLIKVFRSRLGFWYPSCKSEAEILYAMGVPSRRIIEVGVSALQNLYVEESTFV